MKKGGKISHHGQHGRKSTLKDGKEKGWLCWLPLELALAFVEDISEPMLV
jgi:hypothetical protein